MRADLIDAAGKGLTYTYREGAHAFGFVIIVLVDMLANVDAGNAQTIRNARQDNIPDIAEVPTLDERHDEIHAADHDRSPDEEDGELAQSPILEGIGVGEQHHRAEQQTSQSRSG